ncbi:uncharacterized protein LOC131886811 [Tigriopus californicus]|uniref:uncharacterized protein LOC131886811 n=1 Tax=Tigriopus californicus TaxID=6832 RepID=UPI0027DA9DA1|nr:uncharacterized protein LOC131886811 [Tigriopus californicus]
MGLASHCCFCIELRKGVQGIAVVGIGITVLYIFVSLIGGREIFLLLNYFDVNHVYVAIFFCLVNFFVHLLLWHGARDKQKYQLLPWLVFIFVKALIFISVGISLTSQSLGEKHLKVNETCYNCLDQVEKQTLIIVYIFMLSALHLYFWVIVYSLYAKLSVRLEVMTVNVI